MTTPAAAFNRDGQLLVVLQRLLSLELGDLAADMTDTAQQVAEVLGAEKVDEFFSAPT